MIKKSKSILAMAIYLAMSASFADAPHGITLDCPYEYTIYKGSSAAPIDKYYFWATNNTGQNQTLHVRIQMTIPGFDTKVKEYDVLSIPGHMYSMPPDALCMRYKNGKGLYENKMTMDVTGFVNLHAEKTCYIRIK